MNNAPFGEPFVGRVDIIGSQSVNGRIATPDYGVISGSLFESDGSTPLSNGNVEIFILPDFNYAGNIYSLSDASYYLGGLPDEDYALRLNAGYPWANQWYNGQVDGQSADAVAITGAAVITGVNFVAQPGGVISGTVYADDGITPLENINVDLEQGWYGTCTDANGRYAIQGIPYGNHKVVASRDWNWCINQDSVYLIEYYSETTDINLAAPLLITITQDTVTGIDFTMSMGGVITGQVTDAAASLPISATWVYADEYDNGGNGRGGWSDSSGYYTITSLIDADYRVRIDDPNNMPPGYARQYYNAHLYHWQADRVAIIGGGAVGNIDFALEPGGDITGIVYASDGFTPLANINVDIERGGMGTCTDANGMYTLGRLPYDTYRIRAGGDWNWCLDQQSLYVREYYSETLLLDQAVPFTLTAGSDLYTGVNFTLDLGGVITGRVTDAGSGAPLADVNVSASAYDSNNEWYWGNASSDANGYYVIGGLPDEDYRVRVDDSNSIPAGYARQYYDQAVNYDAATPVNISGGGTVTDIDFPLQPGGVITGIVTDENSGLPLENININADLPGQGGMGVCTDANGVYVINGLPYGDYVVSAADGWNWCLDQPNSYVGEFYDGKFFYDQADMIPVNSGSPNVGNINFALGGGSYIAGTALDETSGAPVSNLRMGALIPDLNCPWCSNWVQDADTDVNGKYLLGPLPPGAYVVYACADCNGQFLVNEYYSDVYHIQDAALITVTSGITVTGVDFGLNSGALITGTVTVPPGYSAAGIQIGVWQTIEYGYGTERPTDASGYYQIPVPPIYDSRWAVAARPWGTDLAQKQAHDFDLAENAHWDFDLGPGATIAGRVTDGGVPVANLNLDVHADEMGSGAQTDASGYYTVTNLPPGDYTIETGWWGGDRAHTLYGGHDSDWAERIRLESGQTITGLDFEAPLAGQLEGYVYELDGSTPIEGVRVSAFNDSGVWYGYSQTNGYFTIDLPVGDHIVTFISDEFWETVLGVYPNGRTAANGAPLSINPLPASTFITMTLERPASVSGQVTDAGTGQPLGGIQISALTVDAVNNRETAAEWNGCTDENGSYAIDRLWPGDVIITAVGDCGAYDYQSVTQTLTAVSGGSYTLNLTMTQGTPPPRPFTVRANPASDFTPYTSGQGAYLRTVDQILPALFEPLAQLDDGGNWYSELLVQVPTPANGGAVVHGDQLVVTYTLKPGLLWSDGAPLTSADIRFAWEQMIRPHPQSDGYLAFISTARKIERVDTPDALTAVLTYKPRQFPPAYLGAILYPLPEHVLSGTHPFDVRYGSLFAHNPVGNGPYVVEEWIPGAHLDLRANPNYHKRGLGYPRIPEIRFLFTGDNFWPLAEGSAEVTLVGDGWPDDLAPFDIRVFTSMYNRFDAIMPNLRNPIFQETAVRQAIYRAFDRPAAVNQIAAALPGVTLAPGDASWLPPGHPLAAPFTSYFPDLAAAAAQLTAAGWADTNGNGIRDKGGVELQFDLVYPTGSISRQALAFQFQADMALVGVDVQVVDADWGNMLEDIRYGRLDSYTLGWGFDNRYDPMGDVLFHSSQIASAYNNYSWNLYNTGWRNSANDAFLEAARTELDAAALQADYDDQMAEFSQDMPIWVSHFWAARVASTPILLNFSPPSAQNTPYTWNIAEWEMPANPYDLTVRKQLSPDSPAPQPGSAITYVVSYRNAGAFTVTNAALLDTLSGNVAYVSADPPPDAITGTNLLWNLGDLPGGSPQQTIAIAVQIPATATHGAIISNSVQIGGDQADTQPGNNGFIHQITVREDVDLAVTKNGVGQPAVGEMFDYYIGYANWGGAPASGAVITDTLPPEVRYWSASPPPDGMDGSVVTWTLPTLPGNQWSGQIQVTAEITNVGTVTNTAVINYGGPETSFSNNSDSHVETVADILAPVILRPTQGTTDNTPTFSGSAPSGSVVDFYDLSGGSATWVMSTTATVSGTFSIEPTLSVTGTYAIVAQASKAGLTSNYSNAVTIVVADNLPLDTDLVDISANGAGIASGSVRAEIRTLAHRTLDVEVALPCSVTPTAYLEVTENGLFTYNIPAITTTVAGPSDWLTQYRVWLAEPHSSYEIWVKWECDGVDYSELLIFILIDPDGFVYDQSLVDAGSPITDALVLNATVTAFVKLNDTWQEWPAYLYGQVNPQATDPSVADEVPTAGYYSFLTPSGQYRIEASAPGYQPFQSQVLTVITTPVHLDIGLEPVVGGAGRTQSPLSLAASFKGVDQSTAWVGDTLTYDIWLTNSGDDGTGSTITLVDAIPANTAYVNGSVGLDGVGGVVYDTNTNSIIWTGSLAGGDEAHINYQVQVAGTPGNPFDVVNQTAVSGNIADTFSIPDLTARTTILNVVGVSLTPDGAQTADPGQEAVYSHTITNTGNFTDTFTFTAVSNAEWIVIVPADVTLAPGAAAGIFVTVTVPAAGAASVEVITFTAASLTAPTVKTAVTLTTTVNRQYIYLPVVMKP